jgi:hypothetical protein
LDSSHYVESSPPALQEVFSVGRATPLAGGKILTFGKYFPNEEWSHSDESISISVGIFFCQDFATAEDEGIGFSEVFEFFQSAFFKPLKGRAEAFGEFVDESKRCRIYELREKMLKSFRIVAGDDDLFLLFQEKLYGSQKDELITEVSIGSVSNDEDGISVDREDGWNFIRKEH